MIIHMLSDAVVSRLAGCIFKARAALLVYMILRYCPVLLSVTQLAGCCCPLHFLYTEVEVPWVLSERDTRNS